MSDIEYFDVEIEKDDFGEAEIIEEKTETVNIETDVSKLELTEQDLKTIVESDFKNYQLA